ncbi:hypothetical protein lam_701 [Candidatus Liberibacter americanus str. Sao Paulo]|uniref:Uncharacterized protein n=1 Tax=Candidatus Liberibacter americanus str. Sao Paulo TaxID=1261131 RepID=U6B8I5_9HYPH|nr:hypothetical protein [Candidatus Liberibacter americanus]AHA28047.1 hypothetical protein lam_701 [Candidatus Liberibacter americanus str. Sao Paulo]
MARRKEFVTLEKFSDFEASVVKNQKDISKQYVTRKEFLSLQSSISKQQEGIEEILRILNTTKGIFSSLKVIGIIASSITAVICFFKSIKGWFKA